MSTSHLSGKQIVDDTQAGLTGWIRDTRRMKEVEAASETL
jgi:hypothetical protein